MLLTLPLVPVFMWLIGRYTEQRTREQWSALRRLSTHFLDVVRGLPTLRAFGRAHVQQETIAEVGEAHRRTTMATLRVAFLSGSVLELAATLGVALVAVTVGVRLADGDMALRAGPDGARACARSCTCRSAGSAPSSTPAPTAWRSPSGCSRCSTRRRRASTARAPRRPAPRRPPSASRASATATRHVPGPSWTGSTSTSARARPSRSSARAGPARAPSRRCCSGCSRPTGGGSRSGAPTSRRAIPRVAAEVAWVPQRPALVRGTVAENIRLGAPGASDEAVRAAAALAGADGFVGALPAGYETAIGDGGRALSARRAAPDRPRARIPPRGAARHPRRADRRPRPGERRAVVAAAVARLRARAHGAGDRAPPELGRARRPRRRARGRRPAPSRPERRRRDADPAPPARLVGGRAGRAAARVRRPRRADRRAAASG